MPAKVLIACAATVRSDDVGFSASNWQLVWETTDRLFWHDWSGSRLVRRTDWSTCVRLLVPSRAAVDAAWVCWASR